MRYERPHSTDWVEIKGASELSQDEVDNLFVTEKRIASRATIQPLITDCSFTLRGNPVDVKGQGLGALSWRQWLWLRDQVVEAVKDEMLDPEA